MAELDGQTFAQTYGSDAARHELNMHASHLLSPAQRELIARDFGDRLENSPEGDGSAVNEWPLYLGDIGGYGNMRSYAEALAVARRPRREQVAVDALAALEDAVRALLGVEARLRVAGLDITADRVGTHAAALTALQRRHALDVENGEMV